MATASILLVLALIAFAALIIRHAFSRTMTSDQVVIAVITVGLLIAGGSMHASNYFNSPNLTPQPVNPPTPSYVKPSDMEMLASIHRTSVEIFAGRPGFGGGRMVIPLLEEEYFTPPARMVTSSEAQAPKDDLQSKKVSQKHPSVESLIAAGRIKPAEVGYWGLKMRQFQLVGLVQHSEPRVYVTDKLLEKTNGNTIPTRGLDDFESSALSALQGGTHLRVEERDGTIRMMGPIFAGQRCTECHQRGQMLGAFTYVIERDPNFHPELP
jgi:hypothetical protein